MGDREIPAPHVLQSGDHFKMVGSHAALEQAKVVQLHPVRDRANEVLIGEPVSNAGGAIGPEPAVSLGVAVAGPLPAAVLELDDLCPEPLFDRTVIHVNLPVGSPCPGPFQRSPGFAVSLPSSGDI
jgi:hypothetical protein